MQKLLGKIGLEIHVYPVTKEKLFCRCKASREKGLRANTLICPICTGQPGAKPMLPNEEAVKKAVRIGLMLGCKINSKLGWKRKHYDWPDLPKGYQNTISGAKATPIGVKGNFLGKEIWSMHLEEDPASWEPETGRVDYNRSGLPLIEIITAPEFESAEEVVAWLGKLIHNLAYLKDVDSNAGIKVDVNVSVKGTERVEIKNINSLESIGKAIEYEIERQKSEGSIRETRRFDFASGKTISMRGKEEADDYRFINDPDLQDIVIDEGFVSILKGSLPEKPEKKIEKFIKKHKIDKKNAEVLAKHLDIAEFFEKVAEQIDALFALPWVTIELLRHLNYHSKTLEQLDIGVDDFVKLIKLVKEGKITELQGKQILNKFYPKSFDPTKDFLGKISDAGKLEKIAKKVIAENKKSVEDYLAGEEKALNYLMGKIMDATGRRADFSTAKKILIKLLK